MAVGFIQLNENDTKELRKEIGLSVTTSEDYSISNVNNKDELVHLLKDERIYEEASILNAILDILEQNQLLEIIKSPEFPIQVRIESMWRFNGIPELADLTNSGEKTIAKEAKYRIKELK